MVPRAPQTQPIPDEAYQLGETYHLGVPTAVYKVIYTRSDRLFFYSQIFILILMFGFLVATILALFVFHVRSGFFFPFILMLSSLNILSISRRKNKNRPVASPFERDLRVYVYAGGFIRLRNSRMDVVRWEQIQRVRYIHPSKVYSAGFQSSVTVTRNDGKRFSFGATLTGVDELGVTIEHEYLIRRPVGV